MFIEISPYGMTNELSRAVKVAKGPPVIATDWSQPGRLRLCQLSAATISWGENHMAKRTRPRSRPLGPLIAAGTFTLMLFLGVIYVYVGWGPLVGDSSLVLTTTGFVAMAIGLLAVLVLGVGLMALILSGRRR